jgi:hypothetical protein
LGSDENLSGQLRHIIVLHKKNAMGYYYTNSVYSHGKLLYVEISTKKKERNATKKNGSKKVVFAGETNGVEHQ